MEHPGIAHAVDHIRKMLKSKLDMSIDELKCLNGIYKHKYETLGSEHIFEVVRYLRLHREAEYLLRYYQEIIELPKSVDVSVSNEELVKVITKCTKKTEK